MAEMALCGAFPAPRTRHPSSVIAHRTPGPPRFAAAGACRLAGTRLMRVQRRSCTAAHRLTLLQTGWKESSSRSSGHATHPREGKRSPREVGPGSYRLVPGVNHAFPADSAWPELSGWFFVWASSRHQREAAELLHVQLHGYPGRVRSPGPACFGRPGSSPPGTRAQLPVGSNPLIAPDP